MTSSLFEPLPTIEGGWPCIASDWPSRFRSNSAQRPGRNALRHYSCMAPAEAAALPIKDIAAKDSILWFWVTSPFLVIGAHIPIMRAWGYEPTAMGFVWIKVNDAGRLEWGTGFTTRKNAEHVAIGKRGRSLRIDKAVHEVIFAPSREHSRKPDEFYRRVERYSIGPRLELFARQSRPGWRSWGDEAGKFGEAADG
jgi:N6-adenosine-specific RNA methylase IME4